MPGIIKPMRLGILTRCTPHEGGAIFTVTALGFFDLLEPDYLLTEMGLWPTAAAQLPPGSILDLGTPKPNGEVIVGGSAIPPGGHPVDKQLVSVTVGPITKTVLAIGNRAWVRGDHGPVFSDPMKFKAIPLVPQLAFGGEDVEANPVGRGSGARQLFEAGHKASLPNLEDPSRPILDIDDAPPPAWFGPYPPDAPRRKRHLGTYNRAYMKTHFPGYPADFDTRYFLTAPADQQLDGYFRGDEPIRVSGMSSTHPKVTSRLPGIRARAFIQRTSEPRGLQELAMKLDTVWIFGSVNKGLVAFRGSCLVEDIEGDDVADVMIAYERLEDPPREADHYAEVYRLRRHPTEKAKYLLADHQLSPPIDPAIREARRVRKLQDFERRMQAFSEAQAFQIRKQLEEQGLPEAMIPTLPLPKIPPVAIPTKDEIERGEADFAEMLDDLAEQKKFADTVMVEMEELRRDMIAKSGMAALDALPSLADIAPDIKADPAYAGALGDIQIEEVDRAAVMSQLDQLIEQMPTLADRPAEQQAEVHAAAAAARDLLSGKIYDNADALGGSSEDRFARARARALDLPEAKPFFEARKQVQEAAARLDAADLSDMLSEVREVVGPETISGMLAMMEAEGSDPATVSAARQQLATSEAKLGEILPILKSDVPGEGFDALLSEISAHAASSAPADPEAMVREFTAMFDLMEPLAIEGNRKLRLVSLEPIEPQPPLDADSARRLGRLILDEIGIHDLAGRDLAGADLAGADLSGADLTGTMLDAANLEGAKLAGVKAHRTAFTGANLKGADFHGAELIDANLASARMNGANFAKARIERPHLMLATLDDVDLEGTTLVRWTVANQSFAGVSFNGAHLSECTFMRCIFDRARFKKAHLFKTSFLEGSAVGVRFKGAHLLKVGFIKLPLDEAIFDKATIRESGFIGEPSMQHASFFAVHALKSSWMTADLFRSCFLRADLRSCNFMMSEVRHSDFRLASLRDSLLMRADFRESDFSGANLMGVQFRKANLSFACLRNANAYQADFSLAKLVGADLHDAHLVQTAFRTPESMA
ncbi:uncharacterized protein YjbI with pentapeptide repeats [Amorphus suaedae]